MGKLLTSAYDYILNCGGFDAAVMKLQTNRAIGTLSVRYRGLAHVILQVVVSRNPGTPPLAKRGKIVADAVPGFSEDVISKAVELANASIADSGFSG